jgi:hypothetical protein
MTDFRWLWKGDFDPEHLVDDGEYGWFILRARKPGGDKEANNGKTP